jgi:hypothetical protein
MRSATHPPFAPEIDVTVVEDAERPEGEPFPRI